MLTVVLPLGAMLTSSFMKRWGLPLERQYLTLHNYLHLLTGEKTRRAFLNSLSYGTGAGILALLVGGSTAFLSHTRRAGAGQVLEAVASWPMAFPNIVLAVGAILA
jgi:iron(III) transport system permease protein